MPAPFDYTLDIIDPVAAMQSGMAFGQNQRANEQAMVMNAQNMDLAQAQEGRAQTAFQQQNLVFDQQQQDRAKAQEAAAAMQSDLAGLAAKIEGGDYSSQDFAAIAAKYPDLVDEMSKMWEGTTSERKAADVSQLFQGVSAIKAGRPDLAIQMLEERAVAAENSGDQMEADIARATAAAIKADPAAGLTSLGLLLQTVDPDASLAVFGEAPELTASQKDYKFYEAQETAAGRKPLSFNEWDLQSKKAGAATTTINNAPTSADGTPKVGVSLAEIQTSVAAATDMIDQIAEDPALPKVTGALEGGGGNNVDEFGVAKRAYYGDDGLALIQKIAQLQNTAWLAARDMLKGGGAITDYESKKAEGAMARLSRAQGTEEYKAALKELRDAITEGAKKLQDAGALPAGAGDPGSPEAGADDLDALLREAEGL